MALQETEAKSRTCNLNRALGVRMVTQHVWVLLCLQMEKKNLDQILDQGIKDCFALVQYRLRNKILHTQNRASLENNTFERATSCCICMCHQFQDVPRVPNLLYSTILAGLLLSCF